MTPRRLALTAVVALALAAMAIFVEVILPRHRAEAEARDRILLSPKTPFGAFTLERDGAEWAFSLDASKGWRLDVKGLPAPLSADVRAIDEVHRALSGFGGIRTVLAEDIGAVKDLAQYGLASPRLALTWKDDWSRPRHLVLGAYLGTGQVAALLDGTRLVLLPREVRDVADRDLGVFRNKALINLQWQDIRRLEIQRAAIIPLGLSARVVVERADAASGRPPDTWHLVEPVGHDANPTRVGSLVSKLSTLAAVSFGAESPTEADLVRAGLSPPVAAVTVIRATGDPIHVLLGTDAEEKVAWGRVDDGPIVGLRADLRDDMMLADDYYRDSRPVRLPRWNIVNLRVSKGVDESRIAIEVQKDEKSGWYAVEPRGLLLDQAEADLLLTLLDGIQCGRFEDELAAKPGAADTRWDFQAPGSLQLRASALLPDGRPLTVDLDAVPFLRERATYYAVRTIDQDAREEVCIAGIKIFDPLLKRVRALSASARAEDSARARAEGSAQGSDSGSPPK